MSDTPVPAGLADWMAGVERQLRDLATGNPLDKGAVQDAGGRWVPITQLAFGMVTATDLTTVALTGAASTVGSVGWTRNGPQANVLVSGGRLRVDVAGAVEVSGNKAGAYLGYELLGPGSADDPAQATVTQTVQVAAPDLAVAVMAFDPDGSGMSKQLAAATFGLHTGLARGWYTVRACYYLAFSASSGPPYANFRNRRLAATPY